MENKLDMVTVLKIIGIATSIGKAGIDFAEGEKQCRDVMANFETQIRQDEKEKCVDILCKNNFPLPMAHDEGLNMVNPNPCPMRRDFFKKLIMEDK